LPQDAPLYEEESPEYIDDNPRYPFDTPTVNEAMSWSFVAIVVRTAGFVPNGGFAAITKQKENMVAQRSWA
jgi:hypothetical protein